MTYLQLYHYRRGYVSTGGYVSIGRMDEFLSQLNPDQQRAVQHPGGPALVLAGAGSGKTTVLTHRAAWLIRQGLAKPDNILLVTFTNKAAREMVKRIESLTKFGLQYAGTFHSLCARMLRVHGRHIGLTPSFVIYDTDDQQSLIRHIYREHNFAQVVKPNAARGYISDQKNGLLSPEEAADLAHSEYEVTAARIYKIYQHELTKAGAVDFDDLLLLTLRLLEKHEPTRLYFQRQFSHVLVDEYQDTNKVQYLLTKWWSEPENNLFVVGDFCQSIYSWRGADYRNMMLFRTDYPEHTEYRLEQNYRSTQCILDAATQVISHNRTHPTLALWTAREESESLILQEASSAEIEAVQILSSVKALLDKSNSLQDMAILYRTNAQSRPFEEMFIRNNVPYRLVGGTKFYERKEVKDIIAYARVLTNPTDSVSNRRIEKLGKRRYASFLQWSTNKQSDALLQPPQELLKEILKETKYLDKLDERIEEDQARIDNIVELVAMAAEFTTLPQLLENIALLQETDSNRRNGLSENEPAITMMSLHAAKGLEFGTVFLVGMEEGLLPHSRSLFDPMQLEEERRLCYVGITRAKHRLFLSYARMRSGYNQSSSGIPSRFLQEISAELFDTSPDTMLHRAAASALADSYSWKNQQHSPNSQRENQLRAYQQAGKKSRRIVSDDDLDAVLSGDMDIKAFVRS